MNVWLPKQLNIQHEEVCCSS